MTNYEKRLEEFVSRVSHRTERYQKRAYPNTSETPKFYINNGRKFDKIVRVDGGQSVWGFVAKDSFAFKGTSVKVGDIMMPAGWKAPAKHARGNIFDSLDDGYGPYGPEYLNGGSYPFGDESEDGTVESVSNETVSLEKPEPNPTPEVGTDITNHIGSDSYPYRVVRVSTSGKSFWVKPIEYRLIGGSGMTDSQEYKYGEVIERATESRVSRTKSGGWTSKIGHIGVGYARAYRDPSF